MKLAFRKALLILVSSLIGLLLAEAGLRLFGWADVVLYTANPNFKYLMTPSQKVYSYGHPVFINSLGLRGPELLNPKPGEVTRILFIGDSVAYGGGRIREDQVLCRVVQSLAERQGSKVETVNLSAPGWGPQNWLNYINERGMHDPDIVMIVLPECDLARPMMSMDQVGHESDASLLRLTNVVTKVSHMLIKPHFKNGSKASEVAAQNMIAIQQIRDRVGDRRLLAVLIPTHGFHDEKFWPEFESLFPEKLDLRESLQDQSMFLDGVHLNSAGHRFVGEQIFEWLRSEVDWQ